MTTAQQNPVARLVDLDPRTLASHPQNIRFDLGDVSELASMRTTGVGLIQPVIVVPLEEGGHRIVAGHRRVLAAVGANLPTVQCVERHDLADQTDEQIAAMIAENIQRQEITPDEEVAAYAQLAAFPAWIAERIAERTGRSVERLREGLQAAALPEGVRTYVAAGTMTLDQAAALDEFADDEKATQRILKAAETGYVHYTLADERAKRERKAKAAATRADLRADGVRIVSTPKGWPYSSVEQPLSSLRTKSNRRITDASHARCPGAAAFIDRDGEAVHVCLHPKEWGHKVIGFYKHLTEEEAAAKAAEEGGGGGTGRAVGSGDHCPASVHPGRS
jgi:ParB family transcriptional regulator, chromosome partitioning protein